MSKPKAQKDPKLTNRKDGRAVVHYKGKMYPMGKVGTPEAKTAYHRFCLEVHNNPVKFTPQRDKEDDNVTVQELVAGFLNFSLETHQKPNYTHYRILLTDFLDALFGVTVPGTASFDCVIFCRY